MLHPQAKSVLDELAARSAPMPANEAEWLKGYRDELEQIVAMQGPRPACCVVEREAGGVPLRLYRPDSPAPRPTLLFIHGGGFVAGSLEGYDIPLRHLALRSSWQVASVDYRLAPEHPYPAAPDDCHAALGALRSNLDLEADAGRLAVGGDSAGGLLATVTAMRARDEGFRLLVQLLIYPNTDLRAGDHHASRAVHDGAVIRIDELYRSLDAYLGGVDRDHPHVSPFRASDLSGLCPALIVANEIDPLRDEAEAYAKRLRNAGVAVEEVRLEGMIHSVMQRGGRVDIGDDLITLLASRLKRAAA